MQAIGTEVYVIAPQDSDEQGKRQVNDKHDAQVMCRRLSEYVAGHRKALSVVTRRLADYDLSDEEIEAYATTFLHKGKFVLVKADDDQAEQVMKILNDSGATRVNKHD